MLSGRGGNKLGHGWRGTLSPGGEGVAVNPLPCLQCQARKKIQGSRFRKARPDTPPSLRAYPNGGQVGTMMSSKNGTGQEALLILECGGIARGGGAAKSWRKAHPFRAILGVVSSLLHPL